MTLSRTSSGWTKLGAETLWAFLLLSAILALGIGGVLVGSITALGETLSGDAPSGPAVFWWTAGVSFFALAIGLGVFGNRPLWVDLTTRRLRVLRRTYAFDEIQHAYRLPSGMTADRLVVQLSLRGGLDARIPVTAVELPVLTISELEALIQVIEVAPLVPDPRALLRAPLGLELGPRSEASVTADAISSALMKFQKVSYAKETLLLELRNALALRKSLVEVNGDTESDSDLYRSFSAVMAVTRLKPGYGPADQQTLVTVTGADGAIDNRDYKRGLLGMMGGAFRSRRDEVEAWLQTQPDVQPPPRFGGTWAIGLVILIGAPLSPLFFILLSVSGLMYFLPGAYLLGPAAPAIAFFTWPLFSWVGLLLMSKASVGRFRADRTAALEARRAGADIPVRVRRFFGTPYPDGFFAYHLNILVLTVAVLILCVGLVLIALAFGQVGAPYTPQPWEFPMGLAVLVVAGGVFTIGVRGRARLGGVTARARIEAKLLGYAIERSGV